MSRKTAKKAKEQRIKELERELGELEWKQVVNCLGILFGEYVKHVTKSSLLSADGKSSDDSQVDRAISVILGISNRVGGDFLMKARQLSALYGVEQTTEQEPATEGEEPSEPEEDADGPSVQASE